MSKLCEVLSKVNVQEQEQLIDVVPSPLGGSLPVWLDLPLIFLSLSMHRSSPNAAASTLCHVKYFHEPLDPLAPIFFLLITSGELSFKK